MFVLEINCIGSRVGVMPFGVVFNGVIRSFVLRCSCLRACLGYSFGGLYVNWGLFL